MKPQPCPADAFSLQIVNSFWGKWRGEGLTTPVAQIVALHALSGTNRLTCSRFSNLAVSAEAQRIGERHGLQDRRGNLLVRQPKRLALAAQLIGQEGFGGYRELEQ